MKRIGIIGAGFSGTMAAVNLVNRACLPFEIIIVDRERNFNKGVAYGTYSPNHLLNVPAGKMSAFPNRPDHFLDWAMENVPFDNSLRDMVSKAFLPRQFYGRYLQDIWKGALKNARYKGIKITPLYAHVNDISVANSGISIQVGNEWIALDICIIATGNHQPRHPKVTNSDCYRSSNYFRNPYDQGSVKNNKSDLPIFILGNGLTMVDTVKGLKENGHCGKIISLSPNGFNILPHRHPGIIYPKLLHEIPESASLLQLLGLFNRHVKYVRRLGVSAEPVVDSLRERSSEIWQTFSDTEKQLFMARLKHLWNIARHRLPMHVHEEMYRLKQQGKLEVYSGRLLDIQEHGTYMEVVFTNKIDKKEKRLQVSKIINCTGPESDISRFEDHFLKKALEKGIIAQDRLQLGLNADIDTFRVIGTNGRTVENLYAIGPLLKGMLWESTAVNELREQAKKLAETIIAPWYIELSEYF